MKYTVQFVVLLVCLCTQMFAQVDSNQIARLDSLFSILESKQQSMGSIAISKHGKVAYARGFGFASLKDSTKNVSSTKFRIGSITKMFTATMIVQLIDKQKIKLSSALHEFFPQIPRSRIITINSLLLHRSGIHNFTSDSSFITWLDSAKTKEQMIELISSFPSEFEPESKTAYSNSNYVLLGYILEKIYNKPYAEILQEQICTPLGLKSTYYGGTISPHLSEAFSYEFDSTWHSSTQTHMSIPHGAGAIVSTPSELNIFTHALFSAQLCSKKARAVMTEIREGMGMGVVKMPFYSHFAFGHTGGIDGFVSSAGFFPHDSVGVALCLNGERFPRNSIMIAVLSILYNKEYTLPEFSEFHYEPKELAQFVGVYSSKNFPLKISVAQKGNQLVAQATGQSEFPLSATKPNRFEFSKAGVVLVFNPSASSMELRQSGKVFSFTRE